MREDNYDAMPSDLAKAVGLLRETPPLRPEWRAEVLRRADAPTATRPTRRISLSVPWAVAAGLACALIGAGAMTLLRMAPPAATVVSGQQASTQTLMLPVHFSLNAPNAARVSIVGDFNNWNPTILPMRRSADGRIWEVEVRLPLGRYNYAFMVDGRLARDPDAPSTTDDGFGTPNSVLMVRGS